MVAAAFIARWFIGLAFLTSCLEKLEDRARFQAALRHYGLFRSEQEHGAANTLIAWEGLLAVTLLLGVLPQGVAVLAGLTFGGFAFVMMHRLRKDTGKKIPCGCGGIMGDRTLTWGLAFRNLALACLALLGAASPVAWPAGAGALLPAAIGLAMLAWLSSEVSATVDAVRQQSAQL